MSGGAWPASRPGRRRRLAPARPTLVAVIAGALLLGACGDGDAAGSGADGTVTVLAAASLTDVMAEMGEAFEAANPGTTVELHLGPSSRLREQILAGAPADVYAPADHADVDRLARAGEVAEAEVFARTRMEIAVPAGNPAGVTGLADLADPDLLVGLCAEEVPCGRLGRQALARAGLSAEPDTNATDVRALLTQVASGDLDAGLVYRTDVLAAGDAVEGVAVPPDQNVVVEYPVALVSSRSGGGGAPDAEGIARDFQAFVLSEEAGAILSAHGFDRP